MALKQEAPQRLYLVRHGQTEWNAEGRYQGRSDSRLGERGWQQAHAIADRLAVLCHGCAVASSPLERTLATARVVAARLSCPIEIDNRLIELWYGRWEGLRQCEVAQIWPALLRAWKRRPQDVHFPDGESLAELRHRVCAFMEDVFKRRESVVGVTHDAFIRVAILQVGGKGLDAFRSIRVGNASVTVFSRTDRGFALEP